MPTVEFEVQGMTCGSCAARVERVLSRRTGVEGAAVNFATGRARVAFDPGSASVENLVSVVGDAGYDLVPYRPDTLEARAKGRAGRAIKALLELGAKEAGYAPASGSRSTVS